MTTRFFALANDMLAEVAKHTKEPIDPPQMLLDIIEAALLYLRYGCEVYQYMRPEQKTVIGTINDIKKQQTIGDYFSQYHEVFYSISREDFLYILQVRPQVIAHICALYCREDTFAVQAFKQFTCHGDGIREINGKTGIDLIQTSPDLAMQITKLAALQPRHLFIQELYHWLIAFPMALSDLSLWEGLLTEQIEIIRYISLLATGKRDAGLWELFGQFSEGHPEPLQRWLLVHRDYICQVADLQITWLDKWLEKVEPVAGALSFYRNSSMDISSSKAISNGVMAMV